MKKAGITDYTKFAREVLNSIEDKPISFEVFSDDLDEMIKQGFKISSWAENVYVKIPITNTRGESTAPAIKFLTENGVKLNITAIMTSEQVEHICASLDPNVPSYISVFAGRIADTGRDPIPVIKNSLKHLSEIRCAELIWASPRELLNIFQSDEVGCHIITATADILNKIPLIGLDLREYSLDTVQMFHRDAQKAGYEL